VGKLEGKVAVITGATHHAAHWLEGTSLILMGLARHGMDNFDIALGATG
jgi:hypothetical protein